MTCITFLAIISAEQLLYYLISFSTRWSSYRTNSVTDSCGIDLRHYRRLPLNIKWHRQKSTHASDNIYTVHMIALSKIKLLKRGLHDRILNSAEHKLDVFRI